MDYQVFLKKSIDLEYAVSDLYSLYSECFEDDKEFWTKMAEEEENHAMLLNGIKLAEKIGHSIDLEVEKETVKIEEVILLIKKTIVDYSKNKPTKIDAYLFAIELEKGAFEFHIEKIIFTDTNVELIEKFKMLNQFDGDHIKRITKLL